MHKWLAKQYRLWFLLVGPVTLLLLGSPVVYAATIPVGCSVLDLKDAIETANGDSTADVLELATNCIYTLTAVDNSTPDANGLPVLATDMTFNGNNAIIERNTINGTPEFRFLQIDAGAHVTLDALTLRGGIAPGSGGGGIFNRGVLTLQQVTLSGNGGVLPQSGGAIYNDHGILEIADSILNDNYLDTGIQYDHAGGGAIFSNGTLTIANSLLDHNRSSNNIRGPWWGGGAILADGGTVLINGSTLSNNSANLSGGAILCIQGNLQVNDSHLVANTATNGAGIYTACPVTVNHSEFAQNAAWLGGGAISTSNETSIAESVFFDNTAERGAGIQSLVSVVIVHSSFTNNYAKSDGGGLATASGDARVRLSTFTSNHADRSGGGISGSTLSIQSSTFTNNYSSRGGAVDASESKLKVKDSTFAQNHAAGAQGDGGAIHAVGGKIANSTFAGNIADRRGGGIWNGGAMSVLNVTLYKNLASKGASLYNEQQSVTFRNTILGNGLSATNCALHTGQLIDGGHNLDTDASCGVGPATRILFAKRGLQDNGGPTQTVGLRAASPAVDAGDDALCAAAPIKSRDQRGVKRPQGAHCDIGAFERKRQLRGITQTPD